jgi:hypothetical protein
MTKKIQILFSVLLLMSLSWQCAAKTVIYLSFRSNQKQLAATVCENKSKPKSCCQAKCYLDKELKKEDKRQSDSPSAIKDKTEKYELRSGYISYTCFQSSVLQSVYFLYSGTLPEITGTSVFHPPSFI